VTTGSSSSADWQRARVIGSYGRHALLRNAAGDSAIGRPVSRKLQVVCGDEVTVAVDAQHDEVLITAVQPRRTAVWRSNARGEPELVVANATLMLVVVAPVPAPDFFVVDRYLTAADSAGIKAIIGANKDDLPPADGMLEELNYFAGLGYGALRFSARTALALSPVQAAIAGHCCLLVGQSGVGKSSLLKQLAPGSDAAIGELMRGIEGRHTTTASRLHQVNATTALMDTPGVRDFAPALEPLDDHCLGFREIARLAPQCRFADCRHLLEPQCAVRAALESDAPARRRYESYRRLRRLHNDRMAALKLQGNKAR
jgi:ribosome biogenesis GTPase / thiamine phosphate phosphatase